MSEKVVSVTPASLRQLADAELTAFISDLSRSCPPWEYPGAKVKLVAEKVMDIVLRLEKERDEARAELDRYLTYWGCNTHDDLIKYVEGLELRLRGAEDVCRAAEEWEIARQAILKFETDDIPDQSHYHDLVTVRDAARRGLLEKLAAWRAGSQPSTGP